MKLNNEEVILFRKMIWSYYGNYGRSFPWRNIDDPYKVVVSEIMLQQTQTSRVMQKYEQFIAAFPSFYFLAQATRYEVLSVWQGLGYNRRGKYLHELAQSVINDFNGVLPAQPSKLITFPGIGVATSASIAAFAFNLPTVFIETNIRTVFIHSFFAMKERVYDKEILPIVAQTVDRDNPREWYYALMDYGVMLKHVGVNPSRKSAHYGKQNKFQGSDRQIRGKIIKILTDKKRVLIDEIYTVLGVSKQKFDGILNELLREGMIQKKDEYIGI